MTGQVKNAEAGPLKGALIGCGYFARHHLHAWQQIDGARLVALTDLDVTKAATYGKDFGIEKTYADAAALFEAEDLDFVDIVTTMPSHRALVELAAAHGVPMIVQKPLAPTIEDCRAMVEAAATAGVPLMVHENFRFQQPIRAVREVLDQGTIGRPFFARLSWRTAFDVYAKQPYLAEETRFIILDLMIHLFDVARFLFGDVRRLTARTASVRPGIKGEDAALVLLDHESGMTSIVDATYNSVQDPDPFPETLIEVDGSLGTIRLKPGFEMHITDQEGSRRQDVSPGALPWVTPPWHVVQDSVLAVQRHWIDCLAAGREPATSGADNLKTFALCEAAYASAASGDTLAPVT